MWGEERSLPIVEEITSYAKRLNLRQLEFRAYITLSGIYQQEGELDKARSALETATAMVHPGPFDEELDNKAVHLAYVSPDLRLQKIGDTHKGGSSPLIRRFLSRCT